VTQGFFQRHKHWWVVAVVLPLILVAVGIGILETLSSYKSEVIGTSQDACEGTINKNHVDIFATIIAVDTDALVATVRLDFVPTGDLLNQHDNQYFGSLTRSLTLTTDGLLAQPSGSSATNGSTGPSYTSASSSYVFFPGDYMEDLDVALPLEGGTLNSPSQRGESTAKYPWDSYINTEPFAFQVRQGVGIGGAPVPSCVQLTSSVGGWTVAENAYGFNNAFDISLTRSAPVLFYGYFVIGLMWALALGGVAMAVIMLMRKQDEIDTAAFAYLAALLFAFPLIRQTLPGNPGPGSLIDLVAYYWTEVIVATTLVVLLVRWITLRGKHDRHQAHDDEEEQSVGPGVADTS
jgi:uncharacterized protein DUF4436